MRLALDTLDDIQVASPCSADWDGMAGDDRVRFCSRCRKQVYDLSAITAEQATALLRQEGGTPCVRFYRRRDGTVLTADCLIGLRRFARHPWRWAAMLVAAVLATVLPSLGCTSYMGAPPPPATPGTNRESPPEKQAADHRSPEKKIGLVETTRE